MLSVKIRESDSVRTYVLYGGDVDKLHQREELLIEKVLGTQYMPYRQMFPGVLTVMIDADVIMYQGQHDSDAHRSCDLHEDVELFRAIESELAEFARCRAFPTSKAKPSHIPTDRRNGR